MIRVILPKLLKNTVQLDLHVATTSISTVVLLLIILSNLY